MPPLRLNLGCGADIRPGWVNLDNRPLPGVDVVHNILHLPWPFPDAHFEEVHAKDVFEHVPCHYSYLTEAGQGRPDKLDPRFEMVRFEMPPAWLVLYCKDPLLVVLEEVHRVLAPGGVLSIQWPIPTQANQFGDLTHYRAMDPEAFAKLDPRMSDGKLTTTAKFQVEGAHKEEGNYVMRLVKC